MRGVSIADFDQRHILKVDLADILAAVGEPAEASTWALSGVEAAGGNDAEELHRLSEEQRTIDGRSLALRASSVSQVVEGEFRAYRDGADAPWLIIYAVDSSAFDVLTDDDDVLSRLRATFKNVNVIPDSLYGPTAH